MRPLLVAAVNPHSPLPEDALSPRPIGSSGWRTWKMIQSVTGMSEDEYLAEFDRVNLCTGSWDWEQARHEARKLVLGAKPGSLVAVMGRDAWEALCIPREPPPCGSVKVGGCDEEPSEFYFIPHPSGKNLYYNDQLNRWNVGTLLASLARRGRKTCAA